MLWCVFNIGTISWPHRHSTLLQKCALAVPSGLPSMLILFQGRRKHFRIGQAMKNFLLATLTNVFRTVTTCKAFFMACRCFVVFEADDDILPILKAITCKFRIASALSHPFGLRCRHTHMAKYNVIWIVGLVLQPGPCGKPGRLARSLLTTVPSTSITLAI